MAKKEELVLPSSGASVLFYKDISWGTYSEIVGNPENLESLVTLVPFADRIIREMKDGNGNDVARGKYTNFISQLPAGDALLLMNLVQAEVLGVSKALNTPVYTKKVEELTDMGKKLSDTQRAGTQKD